MQVTAPKRTRGRPRKAPQPADYIQNWRVQRMFEAIASPEQYERFYEHLDACNPGFATDYASKVVEKYFWSQLQASTGLDYSEAMSVPKPKKRPS
jgi:hypothetical protein